MKKPQSKIGSLKNAAAKLALGVGILTGSAACSDMNESPTPGLYNPDGTARDGSAGADGTAYSVHAKALSTLDCVPKYDKIVEGLTEFNIGVDGKNAVYSYIKDGKFYYTVVPNNDTADDTAVSNIKSGKVKTLELKDDQGAKGPVSTATIRNGKIHYVVDTSGGIALYVADVKLTNDSYNISNIQYSNVGFVDIASNDCSGDMLSEGPATQQSIDSQGNVKTYKGLEVCGSAHMPDCKVVGVAKYDKKMFGAPITCQAIMEGSIDKLAKSYNFVSGPGKRKGGQKNNVENVRFSKEKADGTRSMYYLVREIDPNNPKQLMASAYLERCQLGTPKVEPDAGSTDVDAGSADTSSDTSADAGNDTGTSDAGVDAQENPDTADTNQPDTTQPDTSQPDTADAGSDTGADTTQEEDTATEPDTSSPDTTQPDTSKPDAGQPDAGKPDTFDPSKSKAIEITKGDCTVKVKPLAGKSEHVTVSGSGAEECIAEVSYSMGEKASETPMIYKFANDGNGKIVAECVFAPSQQPNCDIISADTRIAVKESGEESLVNVDGVTVGSKASEFKVTSRADESLPGQRTFEVTSFNTPDEPLVFIRSDKYNFEFTVPSNGITYIIDAKTAEAREKFPSIPKPDTSGGADAGSSADAGTVTPPKPEPPKGFFGCTAAPDGTPLSAPSQGQMATLLAAALLLLARRRKEEV